MEKCMKENTGDGLDHSIKVKISESVKRFSESKSQKEMTEEVDEMDQEDQEDEEEDE